MVEAAAAPDSAQPHHPASPAAPPPPSRPRREPAPPSFRPPEPANLRAGARNFKRSFWHPLAAFSGALWLRVTGLFFALIAITMAGGAWHLRNALHPTPGTPTPHRLWAYLLFATLFGYFAISSFVRASLKERRAAQR